MTTRDKLVTEFFELYKEKFGDNPSFRFVDFKSDNEIKLMIYELKENLIC